MLKRVCQYISTHARQHIWQAYAETARVSVKQALFVIDYQIPAVWQLHWWGHQTLTISWLPNWGSSDCMLLCVQMLFIWFICTKYLISPEKMAKILQETFSLLLNAINSFFIFHWNKPNSEFLNTPIRNPTMHHSEENVHISVLNGTLWDMGQVYCGVCEFGLLLWPYKHVKKT